MPLIERVRYLAGLLTICLCAGCAPAYRSYSDCQVPCAYCVPAPLPYTHYAGCGGCPDAAPESLKSGARVDTSAESDSAS